MKYAVLILLLSSFQALAIENKFIVKKSIQDGIQKVEVDLNHDGKVDRIEKYRGELLIFLSRDSKFSGKFDVWSSYSAYTSPKIPVEVTKKDINGDGKVDRIESYYKNPKLGLLIVTTEIDSSYNGKFDKKFSTSSKLFQEDEVNCIGHMNVTDFKILKLSREVGDVNSSLTNGYYTNDLGHRIHQSCLEKWGANSFPAVLNSAMSNGFQCLARLAKDNADKNSKPNGAFENLKALEYLLSSNSVSVVCNQEKYNWPGTSAHASTGPADIIEESNVKHPYISLNINKPEIKGNPTKEEKESISNTLFHEQLHNLGILHGESIEYPYACSTCCSPISKEEEKANACKICSGVYTGTSDKNYLKDMIAFGRSSYHEDRAASAIQKYQQEFPQDRWSLFAYADAATGIFSPVGMQMAKILKGKYKDLTKEEEEHLKNTDSYNQVEHLTDPVTVRFASMTAEALISRFSDGGEKEMLQVLDKNKETIKELLRKEKAATDNSKYVLGDIKEKISKLLSDVWMKGYPKNNSPESDRAYKILKDTGMI